MAITITCDKCHATIQYLPALRKTPPSLCGNCKNDLDAIIKPKTEAYEAEVAAAKAAFING